MLLEGVKIAVGVQRGMSICDTELPLSGRSLEGSADALRVLADELRNSVHI